MRDVPNTEIADVPHQVEFSLTVVLTKAEAFDACDACAEAERALIRSGWLAEADRLAELFALIEGRLTQVGPGRHPRQCDSVSSASKSSDSEFTQ